MKKAITNLTANEKHKLAKSVIPRQHLKQKYTGLELVLMSRLILIRYMTKKKLKSFNGIYLKDIQ